MKKIILKTALITLGVIIILAIAVFGITSFCAPAAMMDFTASLGMESISGDYAYQEYERSGNLECLARSFVVAAEKKDNRTANDRFMLLFGEEGSERRTEFETLCASYEVDKLHEEVTVSYREYLTGLASGVKYRLARTEEAKGEACDFAISETGTFTVGSPVVSLAVEIVSAGDAETAAVCLEKINAQNYEKNETYKDIVKLLEDTANE